MSTEHDFKPGDKLKYFYCDEPVTYIGRTSGGRVVAEKTDGEIFNSPGCTFTPWREPVRVSGWVNVYDGWSSCLYETKEWANIFANEGRIACVYVSGVEGEKSK